MPPRQRQPILLAAIALLALANQGCDASQEISDGCDDFCTRQMANDPNLQMDQCLGTCRSQECNELCGTSEVILGADAGREECRLRCVAEAENPTEPAVYALIEAQADVRIGQRFRFKYSSFGSAVGFTDTGGCSLSNVSTTQSANFRRPPGSPFDDVFSIADPGDGTIIWGLYDARGRTEWVGPGVGSASVQCIFDDDLSDNNTPSQNNGEPSGNGGEPSGSGGEPSGNGGEPSGSGGEPSGNGGEPSGNGGEPSGNGGEPSGNGGEPSGNGGEPSDEIDEDYIVCRLSWSGEASATEFDEDNNVTIRPKAQARIDVACLYTTIERASCDGNCDDDNPCTWDFCDPDKPNVCVNTGLVSALHPIDCTLDDGRLGACALESGNLILANARCAPHPCGPDPCDDGDQCTYDFCKLNATGDGGSCASAGNNTCF